MNWTSKIKTTFKIKFGSADVEQQSSQLEKYGQFLSESYQEFLAEAPNLHPSTQHSKVENDQYITWECV